MQSDFLIALSQAGIANAHDLILDGRLRRYRVEGDKKGKKNGWYRYVQINNEFAYASFGCNKRGISAKWNSKESSSQRLTDYEIKAKKKKEHEIRQSEIKLQADAAIKANKLWGQAQKATNHPYCDKKQVGVYGLRKLHNSLVIPIYVDNYIVSLQFISFDCEMKRFLTGGQKEGGYFWIGQETDVIWLAEGYATAASVHEATGQQVVICFDAGNMPHVAKSLRKKLPEKKMIIASDNDQWTKGNPGISKAQESAALIGAEIKYPNFSYEDPARPTDWNDWHVRYGLESLKNELLGVKVKKEIAEVVEWKTQLIAGKEEVPGYPLFDAKSKFNAYLFLKNHQLFKDMVAYNIFSDEIIFTRCPPWEDEGKFVPRRIEDTDGFAASMELEKCGIRVKNEDVQLSIKLLTKENIINPPKQYFDTLRWDGKPRIDTWLTYYVGAEKQSPDYLRLVGSKWLMGAVARVYQPGVKFDNVLVLEGEQGKKKSMVFEVLADFYNESYFLDFSGDISKKDSVITLQGKLIVEMAELASIRRSDIEEMKAFISRRIDEYRPVYGKFNIRRPRMFIFGGTTNKVNNEYLEDETGARRIWPAECGENIDMDALRADKDQLWAEATHRYKSGERIWLEGEEVQLAKSEQAARQAEDVWREKIEKYVFDLSEVTAAVVAEGIGLLTKDLNNMAIGRIKKCLRELGWKEHRSAQSRIWKRY